MYTGFYNLTERPFELAPNPRYLYLSAQHREALAHLTYGVQERKGLVQLTGEVGTGKTTMLDALAGDLDATAKVARLSHTTIGDADLVRLLARELGVDLPEGVQGSKVDMLARAADQLAVWAAEGRLAVFIVDEAQNLTPAVLEEIRLLSNLRAGNAPALQIVLAGQPELREKLALAELRQLRQRIGVRYHLSPLSRVEAGLYVAHRLSVAGAIERIFGRGALDAIYEYSQGVPRMINAVCDRALLAGYVAGSRRIGSRLVLEAIGSIEGRDATPPEVRVEPARGRGRTVGERRAAPAASLIVVAGAAAVVCGLLLGGGEWRQEPPESTAAGVGLETTAAVEQGTRPDDTADESQRRAPVTDGVAPRLPRGEASSGLRSSGASVSAGQANSAAGRRGSGEPGGPAPPAPARPAAAAGAAPAGRDDAAARPVTVGLIGGPGGSYFVVVTSSRTEEAARGDVESLRASGIAAWVTPVELEESGAWFRVVVEGGYPTFADARPAMGRLRERGYEGAWIWRR